MQLLNFLRRLKSEVQTIVRKVVQIVLIAVLRLYKLVLSPMMGTNCRFYPTCSDYATEALQRHSPIRASKLILLRIFACRPFGYEGYDPVPKCSHQPAERKIHV